jgi:hypothetical protein
MQTKTITLGSSELKIAELNTAQARELIEYGKTDHTPEEWEERKWCTIALAVNNAKQPPTAAMPMGSVAGIDDLKASIGLRSSHEVHAAIMELSGLKVAAPGETKAAAQ